MVPRMSDPIRVYRPMSRQAHDLNIVLDSWVDVYGKDVWGSITRDEGALVDLDPGAREGLLRVTARLRVPSVLDIAEGYVIQSKKAKILWGARSVVSSVLLEGVTAGSYELAVSDSTGFASGDTVLVSGAGNHQMGRLRDVGENTLTLWSDNPLREAYPKGSEVVVCRFWRVAGRLTPVAEGPVMRFLLEQLVGTGGML